MRFLNIRTEMCSKQKMLKKKKKDPLNFTSPNSDELPETSPNR